MKYSISLFWLIMLWINLSGCVVFQESTAQIKELPKTSQTNSQSNMHMEQDNKILSRDYAIAEKALDKAVSERDKKTIRLGLNSRFLPIKQKTVEVIAEIKDETFVPNLIETLGENQAVMTGGTEMQIMQDDLNKAIVFALEQLTGLQFLFLENLSSEDIQRVLKESQEWWKTHQDKDK